MTDDNIDDTIDVAKLCEWLGIPVTYSASYNCLEFEPLTDANDDLRVGRALMLKIKGDAHYTGVVVGVVGANCPLLIDYLLPEFEGWFTRAAWDVYKERRRA